MRALLIVLDSVGIGHAPDAEAYGDAGADTLGHLFEREPWLSLPNLDRIGLAQARLGAAGRERVLAHFTIARLTDEFLEEYQRAQALAGRSDSLAPDGGAGAPKNPLPGDR